MNSHDNSDFVAISPGAENDHASDHGQPGVEGESLRGLTTVEVHGASEPDCSSGQHGSPEDTLVYNPLYPSCRDLTRTVCGSWDDIHSSTPNQKSKPMHLKNLSAISIDQSITEYTPSCLSHKVVEWMPSPSDCDAGLCVCLTRTTSLPDIDNSSEMYLPDDLLTRHVSTGSPTTYTPVTTLGRGFHGQVFAARLKDNPNDKIYILKTIPKASLVRRRVAAVTKELWIHRFITDASLSNKPFPFLQKLKDNLEDEKNLFIVLEYFPTTLAHAETATSFRLSQKTTPGWPSPSKTCQSEPEAVQALRFLAAELTLGLLFLQRHGIVHQNIKPANIMISEGGHAVIGEFSAASALPVSGRPGGDPFERPYPPSCVNQDGRTFGSIVLQPEDTVIFTPLYAAPELLERKENGLLIYDERVDWWSLGVSLYELTTGGIPFHISSDAVSTGKGRRDDGENGLPFDLLEGLDLTCNVHLDDYLRSLLVHDPSHRLSGERAKSHPFLEPLQDIWAEIEDLRHPPCPEPSAPVVHGENIDTSSDLQEDSSAFDAQCTQISCSRRLLESPQSPLDEERYTPREVLLEQNSLGSPFLIRRMEAPAVKRPGSQVLWNDNPLDSNVLQESGTSIILHEEAFMSYYIESSFQTNRSLSIGKPHPSTTSVGRFFLNERSHGRGSMQRQGAASREENFDEDTVRGETSFTDSGLGFSPESWRHRRKTGSRGKPVATHDEILAKPKMADVPEPDWTFDEKITISLLQASSKEQERSEPTVRSRLSKPQSVAAASERIIKAARKRIADTLRRS